MKAKFILVITLFFSVFIFSCEKYEDVKVLNKKIKLLPPVKTKEGIKLEWTEPYLTNLTNYYVCCYDTIVNDIWKINKAIEEEPIPFYDYSSSSMYSNSFVYFNPYPPGMVASIDKSENSFIAENYLLSNELYFRIYAVGDTSVPSNLVKIEFDGIKVVDYYSQQVAFDDEQQYFYFYNPKNQTVEIFDYNSGSIKASNSKIEDNINNILFIQLNGKKYLLMSSYNYIYLLNNTNLQIVRSLEIANYIHSIASDNKKYVFIATDDGILSLDEMLDQKDKRGDEYFQRIFYTNNEIVVFDNSSYNPNYIRYAVSDNGKLTIEKTDFVDYSFSNIRFTKYLSELNVFCLSSEGLVFSKSLNQIGMLQKNEFNYYSDYCSDGNSILFASAENNNQVYMFSTTDYGKKYINGMHYLSTIGTPYELFFSNNKLFVVEHNLMHASSSDRKMVIEEFNF